MKMQNEVRIDISRKVVVKINKLEDNSVEITKYFVTKSNNLFRKGGIKLSLNQVNIVLNTPPNSRKVEQISNKYRIFFGAKTIGSNNTEYYAIAEEENKKGEYKAVYGKNIFIPIATYYKLAEALQSLINLDESADLTLNVKNTKETKLDEIEKGEDIVEKSDQDNEEIEESDEDVEEVEQEEETLSIQEPLPEINISAPQDIYKKVITYISKNSECTTREVIEALQEDPSTVLNALISGVDKDLKLIKSSRWTLDNIDGVADIDAIKSNDDSVTKIKDILDYYLDFTSLDSVLNKPVRLYLSDVGKRFFIVDQKSQNNINELFLTGKTTIHLTENKEKFAKYIFSKKASKVFLGMPVILKPGYDQITKKYTNKVGEISPMMSIPLEFQIQGLELTIRLTNQAPVFNPKFGSKLTNFPSKDDINDEFELQENYNYDELSILNVSKLLLERTKSVMPKFSKYNVFDLDSVSEELEKEAPSFKNIIVIYRSTEDKYTKNLIRELKELSEMDEKKLLKTSLNILIEGNSEQKSSYKITNISPLNEEQEIAVQKSLTNNLTCISGPPGTGKSYVIKNLLTSIIANNKTALFASKNQQAVNIVEEDLNKAFEDGILFRWTRGVDGKLDLLSRKIQKIMSHQPKDGLGEDLIKEVDELYKRKKEIEKTIEELVQKLSALDNLREEIEQMEELMGLRQNNRSSVSSLDLANLIKTINKLENFKYSLWEKITSNNSRKLELENELIFQFNQFQNITSEYLELPVFSLNELNVLKNKLEQLEQYVEKVKKMVNLSIKIKNLPKLEEIAKELQHIDEKLVGYNKDYIVNILSRKEVKARTSKELSLSIHAFNAYVQNASSANKNTRGNLQKAHKCFNDVLEVIPIWSTSNLSAYYYPLESSLFDYLIIDEATQSDLPSLIPLLYRSKNLVVIGDDLQLQKITSVTPNYDEKLQEKHNLGFRSGFKYSASRNSVFDLAYREVTSPKVVLTEHFRCHPQIIQFANENWYSKRNIRLEPYTYVQSVQGYDHLAVDIINVTDSKAFPSISGLVNPIEAEAVVKKLKDLLKKTDPSLTIGIVTPFRHQAIRITDLIQKTVAEDIIKSREIIAATAHKFQGDARDIILFSPVISTFEEKHKEKINNGFRFLNSQSELFNVAITRAKSGFLVVGNKEVLASAPVDYLRNLVSYVDSLREEESAKIQSREKKFESPLEKILYDKLKAEGISVEVQYPLDRFRLDFAYIDEDKRIDIELDGTQFHTDFNGRRVRSDIRRDKHVQSRGWEVIRFWSYEVMNDLDGVIERIRARIL